MLKFFQLLHNNMDTLIIITASLYDKLHFRLKSTLSLLDKVNDTIINLIRVRQMEIENIKKGRQAMITFEELIQRKQKSLLINGK